MREYGMETRRRTDHLYEGTGPCNAVGGGAHIGGVLEDFHARELTLDGEVVREETLVRGGRVVGGSVYGDLAGFDRVTGVCSGVRLGVNFGQDTGFGLGLTLGPVVKWPFATIWSDQVGLPGTRHKLVRIDGYFNGGFAAGVADVDNDYVGIVGVSKYVGANFDLGVYVWKPPLRRERITLDGEVDLFEPTHTPRVFLGLSWTTGYTWRAPFLVDGEPIDSDDDGPLGYWSNTVVLKVGVEVTEAHGPLRQAWDPPAVLR